jgi:hypothetical protein
MTERATIRLGIPTLLLASTAGAVTVALHTATTEVPSFAFNSRVVLAVHLALLFFYAALLLLVPLVRAVASGELPVELSLKGARWTEGIDDIGDVVFERLARAEGDALLLGDEVKREIEELRLLLNEIHQG